MTNSDDQETDKNLNKKVKKPPPEKRDVDSKKLLDKTKIYRATPASGKESLPSKQQTSGVTDPGGKNTPQSNTAGGSHTPLSTTGHHPHQDDVTRFRAPDHDQLQHHGKVSGDEQKTRIKPAQHHHNSSVETPAGTKMQILKERFVLEKVLGVGGMGVVYKARDLLKVEARDRDPYVAIKVLSEEFKTHPEAFIALSREAKKARDIAHPSVVKVYDFDRDGDVAFMTMEYMVGKPLDQMIKQYHATGLPRDDAWVILSGMCSALIRAHQENIVHSDFKPGNVFVTNSGMAKIFDFGIARAVANIDRKTGKTQDYTVFDAGNLGALTPAYASREMLLGKTPDTRDDIYALGCVAYEILTGEHPFNKLPADEAYKKNLKPKRITDISKRQWKAIEAALAFKRANRIESVEEFHLQLTTSKKPKSLIAASVLVLAGISFFAYTEMFVKPTPQPAPQLVDLDEFEFNIRYKLFKEEIEALLTKPSFSNEWENAIWGQVGGLAIILKEKSDQWFSETRKKIYQLYIQKITEVINRADYNLANTLIENARRYTDDFALLDAKKTELAQAIQLREEQEKIFAAAKRASDAKKQTRSVNQKNSISLFNVALANVNNQLKCKSKLNMRDFNIAITKLRTLDSKKYAGLESDLITKLAQCITTIGKRYPEHALDSKRYALRIFKNNPAIMAVVIKTRDVCDPSIAGLGASGDRAVCRDKLQSGGEGPALVVIPGNSRVRSFAIGKYEISIGELEIFCKKSKQCDSRTDGNKNLPITNINISTASAYLTWLSKNTKKKYRLPTKREWAYAAKSKTYALDPNRNCRLSSRGIQKGGKLVRTNTGKQNSWGLVNYAGNAQEWVYDTSKKLVAIGGSHKSLMEACTDKTVISHSGNADSQTGLRVARDL